MAETPEPPNRHAVLRRAEFADAELLAHLSARLFEQAFGDANDPDNMRAYVSSAFSVSAQSVELADDERMIWLAEDHDRSPIGYATMKRGGSADGVVSKNAAEIQRIYVDRTWHGQGVGHALMTVCVDQARAWECSAIWLGVWEQNPRAIAFYERTGFRKVGTQTFVLGHDIQRDHVMVRDLS